MPRPIINNLVFALPNGEIIEGRVEYNDETHIYYFHLTYRGKTAKGIGLNTSAALADGMKWLKIWTPINFEKVYQQYTEQYYPQKAKDSFEIDPKKREEWKRELDRELGRI